MGAAGAIGAGIAASAGSAIGALGSWSASDQRASLCDFPIRTQRVRSFWVLHASIAVCYGTTNRTVLTNQGVIREPQRGLRSMRHLIVMCCVDLARRLSRCWA
jgi:hypothetical protein